MSKVFIPSITKSKSNLKPGDLIKLSDISSSVTLFKESLYHVEMMKFNPKFNLSDGALTINMTMTRKDVAMILVIYDLNFENNSFTEMLMLTSFGKMGWIGEPKNFFKHV